MADTTKLRPWIQVLSSAGDTTTVVLSASQGQQPAVGLSVDIRAEFMPSAGHAHITAPLDFENAPTHVYGGPDPVAQAVTGYFKKGNSRTKSLSEVTDSNGEITFAFVAGWVGGKVDVIAATEVAGQLIVDTLEVVERVSGLTSLHSNPTALANALFVGGTSHHPQFQNWYVLPAPGDSLALFALRMHALGGTQYPQFNDASLPYGGSFSVAPPLGATGVRMDAPFRPHNSHAIGVDIDVALCWSSMSGATSEQTGRVSPTEDPPNVFACPSDSEIDEAQLRERANALGFEVFPEDNHFHLRFIGN